MVTTLSPGPTVTAEGVLRPYNKPGISKRKKRALPVMGQVAPLSFDILLRKRFPVPFDVSAAMAVNLGPGKDGIGAVIRGWYDAVGEHDAIVKSCEEKMDEVDENQRVHLTKQRIYENHAMAWDQFMQDAETERKWYDYSDLKRDVGHYQEPSQIEEATNTGREFKLVLERLKTFQQLKPWAEKLDAFFSKLKEKESECDAAKKAVRQAEEELEELLKREQQVADRVTESHIRAAERGQSLAEAFPTIREGFCLASVNGVDVEFWTHDSIMDFIDKTPLPHNCEFRRYDYRLNWLTSKWESLQECREAGKYWPDLTFERDMLLGAVRKGDIALAKKHLASGADVDGGDECGNTAMHIATSRDDVEMMCFLLDEARASLEARNKNMDTPLLLAARKGNMEALRLLTSRGAKADAMDKLHRSCLFLSLMSKNVAMVQHLLTCTPSATFAAQDKVWGWTVLHCAASRGDRELVDMLVKSGASVHKKSNNKKTALDVARQGHHEPVVEYLETFIREEPAHCVEEHIWIGDKRACFPTFATTTEFTAILSIFDRGEQDSRTKWTETDKQVRHYKAVIHNMAEQDRSDKSWQALALHLSGMVSFIDEAVAKHDMLLIHCETGISTSLAVFAAYNFLKRQVSVSETIKQVRAVRPQMILSGSMIRGLLQMEDGLRDKQRKRLDATMRQSILFSIAF